MPREVIIVFPMFRCYEVEGSVRLRGGQSSLWDYAFISKAARRFRYQGQNSLAGTFQMIFPTLE